MLGGNLGSLLYGHVSVMLQKLAKGLRFKHIILHSSETKLQHTKFEILNTPNLVYCNFIHHDFVLKIFAISQFCEEKKFVRLVISVMKFGLI